jgi:serine/threonine protein kinase
LELKHPNIVELFDGWVEPKGVHYPSQLKLKKETIKFFLEMEFCNKNSLQSCLPQVGGDIRKVRPLFRDVVSGLAFIHEKRMMHRDLKPDNILLTTVNNVTVAKLGDQGLARHIDSSKPSHNPYMTEVGTVMYMSPEQVGVFIQGMRSICFKNVLCF